MPVHQASRYYPGSLEAGMPVPMPTMGSSYLQLPIRRGALDRLFDDLAGISIHTRVVLLSFVVLFLFLVAVERGRAIRMRRLERQRAAANPFPHGQQSQAQRTSPTTYPMPFMDPVGKFLHQSGERLGVYPVMPSGRQSGMAADGFPLSGRASG